MTAEKMSPASEHDCAHVLQRVLPRHYGEPSIVFTVPTDVVG